MSLTMQGKRHTLNVIFRFGSALDRWRHYVQCKISDLKQNQLRTTSQSVLLSIQKLQLSLNVF